MTHGSPARTYGVGKTRAMTAREYRMRSKQCTAPMHNARDEDVDPRGDGYRNQRREVNEGREGGGEEGREERKGVVPIAPLYMMHDAPGSWGSSERMRTCPGQCRSAHTMSKAE